MNKKKYKKHWDLSYKRLENNLKYPNEEIIKFLNKFILKKKIKKNKIKFLDIGCGNGRNVKYILENGYSVVGIDISKIAINNAKKFLKESKLKNSKYKLINISSDEFKYKLNSFDYIISDSTLDSMPVDEFKKSVKLIYNMIKPDGLVYLNLINKKNVTHSGKFLNKYDFLIKSKHENKTIQSYFDTKRINQSFKNFKVIEKYEIIKLKGKKILDARYHLILKKKI